MKIKDLIKKLERYDENEEVYFSYPAQDYWNSFNVSSIGTVDKLDCKKSKYQNEIKLCRGEKDLVEATEERIVLTF
jgi:hypothetical protein